MLISKRSPRRSDRFPSRLGDGGPGGLPLGQYLHLRETLGACAVHVVLLATLVVLLACLAVSSDTMLRALRPGSGSWLRLLSGVLMLIFTLSAGRRLYYKVVEMRQIWRRMSGLRNSFRHPGEDGGTTAADPERRG